MAEEKRSNIRVLLRVFDDGDMYSIPGILHIRGMLGIELEIIGPRGGVREHVALDVSDARRVASALFEQANYVARNKANQHKKYQREHEARRERKEFSSIPVTGDVPEFWGMTFKEGQNPVWLIR